MWIHAYLRFTMVARNKCIRYDEVAEAFFSCGPEDTQVREIVRLSRGTVQSEAIGQGNSLQLMHKMGYSLRRIEMLCRLVITKQNRDLQQCTLPELLLCMIRNASARQMLLGLQVDLRAAAVAGGIYFADQLRYEMPKSAFDNTKLESWDLIKSNLSSCLGVSSVFVEGAVCTVLLLLDSCTELHQLFGYRLVCCLENVDQPNNRVSGLEQCRQMQGVLTIRRVLCRVP